MTSKLVIPKILKENNMAEGIKALVGRKMTKSVKFMGEDVKISKLSVLEVMEIQDRAKAIEKDETEGFNILKTVIRASVENAKDLSDQDFDNFPLDELSKLSNEIMKFSGIGQDQGK
jgi:hypothetical protein